MEDKQLNIYQPLPSVRRFPFTDPAEKDDSKNDDHSLPKIPPLPSYRSELKSGPIRNAGTVPFVWEKSPGMPKYESKPRSCTVKIPDIAPKLPPGRILEMRKQTAKHLSGRKHHKRVPYDSDSVSALDASKPKVESSGDTKDVMNSDIREQDEEYLDAIHKFSRTESFFLNCSSSGISELDNSCLDTSRCFTTDPQTRNFMMDRFLPAAKAMTLEALRYAPRKQPVTQEQPRQTAKVISGDNRHPLLYGPNVVPHYTQEKEEEEESVVDYDVHEQFPVKACGLLPQLCFKSCVFLLNPLPGMRDRTRAPVSTRSRTQKSSSYAGSHGETENEHIKATAYEQRPVRDFWSSEHEHRSALKNQSDQMKFDQQNLKLSTTSRQLEGSAMSSYDYDLPRFAFSEDRKAFSSPGEAKITGVTGVNSSGKRCRTFRELLADPKSEEESYSRNPTIEKTLHVDIVHTVESLSRYSCGSDVKGLLNSKTVVNDFLEKSVTTETTVLADSSIKDREDFIVDRKEENLKVMAQKNDDDFSFPSLSDKSNQVLATKFTKDSIKFKDFAKDLNTTRISKVLNNVTDSKSQQSLKLEDSEKSEGSYIPIPPPLPNSPSDSWLLRTFPSIGPKTPSFQAHSGKGIHPVSHTSKTTSVNHKWETIVKTTKAQN